MDNRFLILSERSKKEILDFLPSDENIFKMANFFYNFADSTRLKILSLLSLSDMCVSDISTILGLRQTTVSHSLQILRNQKLVEFKRYGKILIYTLNKKAVNDIMLTATYCI